MTRKTLGFGSRVYADSGICPTDSGSNVTGSDVRFARRCAPFGVFLASVNLASVRFNYRGRVAVIPLVNLLVVSGLPPLLVKDGLPPAWVVVASVELEPIAHALHRE